MAKGTQPNLDREVVRTPLPQRPGRRSSDAANAHRAATDELLLTSLMRAQLGVTLMALAPTAALLIAYPLVASIVPSLASAHVFRLPLALLVLGGAIYPPIVLIGFSYVRRAERVERQFAELVQKQ
jgi:Flp pilus assembly protein TadB